MTERPGPAGGSLRPTSPVVLALWALAGLVVGWLVHPLADRSGTPPVVTWLQPLGLALVAAILGAAAWATWRTVHVRRERLDPTQAVNRLVLARACSLVGALVGGGYLGYALSWLGEPAEVVETRVLRPGVAVLTCAAVVVAALLLERACRVPTDDDGGEESA